jgi:hypothetical protein
MSNNVWLTSQSLAYGRCIGKSYTEVSKDMCQAEFQAFKDCVQVRGYRLSQPLVDVPQAAAISISGYYSAPVGIY